MAENIPSRTIMYPANVPGLRLDWKFRCGDAITAAPAVADGVVYVGSHDHHLYALEARTGNVLWRYTAGGSITTSAVVAADTVYFGAMDGTVYALEARTGGQLWTNNT